MRSEKIKRVTVHKLGLSVIALALLAAEPARAADVPNPTPAKAPAAVSALDWSGFYLGTHLGYATGSSDWSATQASAAAPSLSGSLDLFSRAGGLIGGFQAGYNVMMPSRLVLGVEADVSFPNYLDGMQTFSAPSIGQASYHDAVKAAGTVRARVGYGFRDWLVYGTGGFAWSRDQLTRTQLAGMPAGGTASPGTVESAFVSRAGWALGAGVELPFLPHWTAKLEYLFAEFGRSSVTFPAGTQKFDSDLVLHEVQAGLNYRFDDPGKRSSGMTEASVSSDDWAIHGQTTFLNQYAFPFRAPYRGPNSLDSNAGRETWDATLYLGARLWSGAELWVNPEIDQGFGLSDTHGVAGFPSGEAYKIGSTYPYTRLHRYFLRQTIGLGGETEKIEPDLNQFGGSQSADRLVFTVGKFAVTDIFDTNKYAHDPRNDFMNWALIDTGSFDYAADAWGYTYGAAMEWYQGRWTLRVGLFDLSIVPNSTNLDPQFRQFQGIVELEERHDLWGQPGKLKVTGFLSRGRMGRYEDAILLAESTGAPADTAAVRRYTSRTGISLNVEQQLSSDLGVFARAGLASGDVEPYEFTDIDRTIAAGLSLSGKQWGRPNDTVGLAGIVNAISGPHQAYFNAGGLGILIGDGTLPHPGPEDIIETYYSFPVSTCRVTLDYQFILNPGYNRDRGPVSVISTRIHVQF
jgi:high affinity Mn2+ porin